MTLPMLSGKLYAVFDPHLIQQVLRARTASFEAFSVEFVEKVFAISKEAFSKLNTPTVYPDFTEAIHVSFQTESLHKMNMRWMTCFAQKINPIGAGKPVIDTQNAGKEHITTDGTLEVDNFWLWTRDVMSLATTKSLYGDHDPFSQDKSLLDAIW
jgi:hypothetical protein